MNIFECFGDMYFDEKYRHYWDDVEVLKVQISKKTNTMYVDVRCRHAIVRKVRKEMEKALTKRYVSEQVKQVEIREHYQISSQHTPETVWTMYHEVFVNEINDSSVMEASLLHRAKVSFVQNKMLIHVDNHFINRSLMGKITETIETIYRERFDMELSIEVIYDTVVYPSPDDTDDIPKEETLEARNINAEESVQDEEEQKDIVSAVDNRDINEINEQQDNKQQKNEQSSEKTQEIKESPNKEAVPKKEAVSKKEMPSEYNKKFMKKKLPEDPDIFFGRPFEGDSVPIATVTDEIGDVVVSGKIIHTESRPIQNGKNLYIASMTDFTDTINIKVFIRDEDKEDFELHWKNGACIKTKAMAMFDRYDKEISLGSVFGIKTIPEFVKKRMDESNQKRIELHAHTKMSEMDAVIDAENLVQTAFRWGHKAVAITDHGVVHAFPEAFHALDKLKLSNEEKARAEAFKIIYGVEAYLIDDIASGIAKGDLSRSLSNSFVAFDIETTGLVASADKIIEIGAVRITDGQLTDSFCTFVNPQIPIPAKIEKLTKIRDEDVMNAPVIEQVLPEFLSFVKDATLVAHNADFDTGFIKHAAQQQGLSCDFTVVDTLAMSRVLMPELANHKLDTVAKALSISLENHHRATDDAKAAGEICLKLIERFILQGYKTFQEVNESIGTSPELIKNKPFYHTILLCKNDIGRVNLYRMVSQSHLEYFKKVPRIPKSLLIKYREGILVGSACEAGELFRALLNEQPQDEIAKLCEFYDYFEVQPLGNNRFMIEADDHGYQNVHSEDDLIELNKQIIHLGEKFHKPVVATGDVHFMNPEDEVYRRILMSAKGFTDADKQAPLYMRTTEEMLQEFSYLDMDTAYELVVENPNRICDMIEKIAPVRPDKCPPVIENSSEDLKEICYRKAHEMYGENLPQIVGSRLKRELESIIKNGFAVMYIIAQKLVWKSNEDGYLVGSRGSVGSSFAATMAGITEVNPLSAHYYCPECFYSDFDQSDIVKEFAKKGLSGCDLPDKECPVCHKPLKKDGHNIPFETFLGFKGNKEPDIDLNFSGEYQSKAHDYTEVIFGKGQTFRAGTISGVAEKTAYGYVLKYNEEHHIQQRRAETERISSGCVGVRRTTGQHPGGIVVLPLGEEITTFTPVQRPANDMQAKSVTTHFDYHSIDHNLLKLDILGHDDPTMIRKLEDLTGLDAKTLPMDDPKVLSLLQSTEALGIRPEDIGGCSVGSLGLPELGTDFVIGMLMDTKPSSFSEVVRISGLSHGTDVWLNNTQLLIKDKKCTLSTAICTRDDIMLYLIDMGLDKEFSFMIMESVRKGKGLTPEMENEMIVHQVPDWYIWSCKQIKYMFPKAHAVAYVTMAFRVAYFKIYYPLAYYAAFFSIRADSINYQKMCRGREAMEYNMNEIKLKMDTKTATAVEEDMYRVMKIVQEMYARGFDFMPIDIFKAKAHEFQIIDGKLMPALTAIDGLGDKAAEAIEEAVKDGPFLSQEEFKQRCKVNQTSVEEMVNLGMLGSIPKTNQISLFDFMG